ncbi:hypothetical protein GW927_01710 [Candidatus Pacearchaeota archaeon]|nr:hypothetical protein [Candidatus Pacearchaeota archaeon]
MSPEEVRKAIVDQNLGEGDPCPGRCGGTLHVIEDDGTKYIQCSQHSDHYAVAG